MKLNESVFFRKESKWGGIVVDQEQCFVVNGPTYQLLEKIREGKEPERIAAEFGVKVADLANILGLLTRAGILEVEDNRKEPPNSAQSPESATPIRPGINILDQCLDSPLTVTLQINNECNLQCKHCFSNANRENGERLTLTKMKSVIDELVELRIMHLVFTGGEPLLSSHLRPLLEYCREKGLKKALYTNGTLIDQATVEMLQEVKVDKIQISLDGYRPETHDQFRGVSDAMRQAVAGIRLLTAHGFFVIINTVVTKNNLTELLDLNQFLGDIGVSVHRLNRCFPIGRAKEGDSMGISREDYRKYVKPLLGRNGTLKTIASESFDIFDGEKPYNECSAALTHCSIGLYGHVVPCNYMKNNEVIQLLKPDTVYEKPFKEIWDSSRLLNLIRDRSRIQPCGSCENLPTCRGGCRTGALSRTGNLAANDPLCPKRTPV